MTASDHHLPKPPAEPAPVRRRAVPWKALGDELKARSAGKPAPSLDELDARGSPLAQPVPRLPGSPAGEVQQEPTVPAVVSVFVGEQLRAHYAGLLREPVPDRFLDLLKALPRGDREGGR